MRKPAIALVAATALTVPVAALAQSDADRAAVTALSSRWHASTSADDLADVLASDFQRPMANGRIFTRDDQLGALRALSPAPPGFSTRFERFDVRFYGEVAIATGIAALTNAAGEIVDRNAFTDIFAHRNGRWQMVGAQRTQIKSN